MAAKQYATKQRMDNCGNRKKKHLETNENKNTMI